MPRNKRSFRGRKRKTRRNKRFSKKKPVKSVIIRSPSIIPDRLFVKLKYFRESLLAMNSAANSQVFWRGNGAYDPEGGLGGHSPMGYDQWAQLYQNYRVHKSFIKIRLARTSESIHMSLTPSTISSIPLNTYTAKEMPYTKYTTVSTSLALRPLVSSSMMSKKIFGVKSISYEDGFSSTVGNVPTDQWFWVMNFSSYNGSTAITAYFDIEIVYWIEFFNRIELSQSGIIGDGIMINNQDTPFGQTGPTGPGQEDGGVTGSTNPFYGVTGGHGDAP